MYESLLIGTPVQINRIFTPDRRETISKLSDLYPEVIKTEDLAKHSRELSEVKYVFSTWGPPLFTDEQLAQLPNLEAVVYAAGSSRAELTKLSGVSAPTMLKLLDDLIEAELIEEQVHTPEGKGRPSKVYRIASQSAQVFGIIIGLDSCEIFSSGIDGKIKAKSSKSFSTPDNYTDLLNILNIYIKTELSQNGHVYKGVGLSVPGLIDQRTQTVTLSPNLQFLNGKQIACDLSELSGLNCKMIHEEHALCLAERYCGGAKNEDNFVVLDITAGIGTGIYSGGQYLSGSHGYAGEIGHVTVELDGQLCSCGNTGCLETVAGDVALTKAVAKKMDSNLDMQELIEQVNQGQIDIEKELDHTLEYLSIGLAMIINIFNPTQVFVNSQIFKLKKASLADLRKRVSKRVLSPSFENCQIALTKADRRQGTVLGICNHLFELIGPKFD